MIDVVARLRAAGCVFAEDEAALIVEAAEGDAGRVEQLVAARVAGLPLEHLLGWAEFGGLRVRVGAGVFVPRQRTLFLAERVTALAEADAVVVDLCCGAGAIGAYIASRRPDAAIFAADVDPDAVASARHNLPAERVFEGDLFDALPTRLRGRIDVLAVNAPYVPTGQIGLMPPEAREHEHRVALDGGADGLDLHRRVAAEAADWLAPGGSVLIETSAEQADATAALLAAAGLAARVDADPERWATIAVGRKPAS